MTSRRISFSWFLALCLGNFVVTSFAHAQGSPQGTIKHVIIVIQENRTPDNLFFLDSNLVTNGADVHPPGAPPSGYCGSQTIPLTSFPLDACFDPRHQHVDWESMYNGGDLCGACDVRLDTKHCGTNPPSPPCPVPNHQAYCPEYSYAGNPEWDHANHHTLLEPYFKIAEQNGFSNRMFQTNRGPSFPAHLFLLSGTSAPFPYLANDFHNAWFAAENPTRPAPNQNNNQITGCIGPLDQYVMAIDDAGHEPTKLQCENNSPDPRCQRPCYNHPTLVSVLNTQTPQITWKYYARNPADQWTAPTAISGICLPTPSQNGVACTGRYWNNNLAAALPTQNDEAPILTAIETCSQENCSDGGVPHAGVVIDSAGNLYGTAFNVFELTPSPTGWTETVLYDFCSKPDCSDGRLPYGGLIRDAKGNLYGMAAQGGTFDFGAVYRVRPMPDGTWTERVLHSFGGFPADGKFPGDGNLFMDDAGNLYGTTTDGGKHTCINAHCGTVYQLTRQPNGHWKETILHDFKSVSAGFSPNAGVVMDKAGNLYGTAAGGSTKCACGVVYKLAPKPDGTWTYSLIHQFKGSDGYAPNANLILDDKGNLYGTTILGGPGGAGVVFEITP